MIEDRYFSGAFPSGYLGRYWPAVSPSTVPIAGGGGRVHRAARRPLSPPESRLHLGVAVSRAMARGIAAGERVAHGAAQPAIAAFRSSARGRVVAGGDEEACIACIFLS